MKINNFSAGPSKIPQTVLDDLAKDIINYQDLGYSVLELSHRSKIFENIINQTKSKLKQILDIPNNFEIIFLQGGATFQNTFIPANKPSLLENIAFLVSGTWGKKTHEDFQKFYGKKIQKFEIPNVNVGISDLVSHVKLNQSKYIYLTSNETIEGIQIKNFKQFTEKKLIIDMSSDFCSYNFDWHNISFLYAGAQKNLGIPGVTVCIFDTDFVEKNNLTSYLNIQNHIDKNSLFNTPPTFSIYVMLKMLNWIESSGGLKELEFRNISKAEKIYSFLDENEDSLISLAPKLWRSNANIVFDFKKSSLTDSFLQKSLENGFIGLNGHRSVGGVRVSNYNSITEEMVADFLFFLDEFISSN